MDFRKFTAFPLTFPPMSDTFLFFVGPKSYTKPTFKTIIETNINKEMIKKRFTEQVQESMHDVYEILKETKRQNYQQIFTQLTW